MPARVKNLEDQGSFKILTVSLAGTVMRAILSESQTVPEGRAWLRFPPQWTKLFANERLVN